MRQLKHLLGGTHPLHKSPSDSPCWSGSAFLDTMALMAGKVMLDMAATAPAAHIILGEKEAAVRRQTAKGQPQTSTAAVQHFPLPGDRELPQSHRREKPADARRQAWAYSYQGCDPKPYQASCRIWKPSPNRMVFLFPIERMRIPNTTVWKEKQVLSK